MGSKPQYRVSESQNHEWFYELVAANGQTLVTSEMYTRRDDAERAVEGVKRAAAEAEDANAVRQ